MTFATRLRVLYLLWSSSFWAAHSFTNHDIMRSSSAVNKSLFAISRQYTVPSRRLEPPFPNGPCGGTVVTIPPEDTFGIDPKLSGNTILLPPRPIQVWLPPGYSPSSSTRHPVLYCHDGQNAMDDASSWTGMSWRLTGALTRLAERNMLSCPTPLVVLLPSSAENFIPGLPRRHLEYGDVSQVFAQAHADFVAQTVKPLVDATFRTRSQESFAIGSSLGGQASFHLLLRHANDFAGAACLSPAFQPSLLASAATSARLLQGKRIYIDIGGDMEEEKVPWLDLMDHLTPEHWWNPGYFWLDTPLQGSVDAMRWILRMAGVDHAYYEAPGGRHNERAWAQRIDLPLLHLFGNPP